MQIGFALEYSLGHATHAENLKRFVANDPDVSPVYVDLAYDVVPMPPLLRPAFKDNWNVRASYAARERLAPIQKSLSAIFFHTQVTSLLSAGLMRRVPSIISLDATPIQFDSLGAAYRHGKSRPPMEWLKKQAHERAFSAATCLVTWSQWTKDSLVEDYGVPAAKIDVIPPGIDLDLWQVDRAARTESGAATFLFVGGDFERKGGAVLLGAFRQVRREYPGVMLLIATKSRVEGDDEPGVEVHYGLTPNSPELRALYARADVFAFPTFGDCLPLAVMEALAAGLPVVTSHVGALAEAVTDGDCGLVVPPGDAQALAAALSKLAANAALRREMSERAVLRARERFDAGVNYKRLIDTLKGIALK